MAIEDWEDPVVEPRSHTLAGFRPGRGFSPSSMDDARQPPESIEFELDEEPAAEPFGELVSELWKG